MPTDDERRRVAAVLREKHRERTRPGQFEPQDVNLQAWRYLKDLESCMPDGDSLFTVLADLIDPDTDGRDALLALAVECKLVSSVYSVMAPEAEDEGLQELFSALAERELKISNAITKALGGEK